MVHPCCWLAVVRLSWGCGAPRPALQVFVTSKDGTQVPMFVVHKKGIELDGTNPTLL